MYANGALVARTDPPGQPSTFTLSVPIIGGTRYILAMTGSVGEPYGGYRGMPGLRYVPGLMTGMELCHRRF